MLRNTIIILYVLLQFIFWHSLWKQGSTHIQEFLDSMVQIERELDRHGNRFRLKNTYNTTNISVSVYI